MPRNTKHCLTTERNDSLDEPNADNLNDRFDKTVLDVVTSIFYLQSKIRHCMSGVLALHVDIVF